MPMRATLVFAMGDAGDVRGGDCDRGLAGVCAGDAGGVVRLLRLGVNTVLLVTVAAAMLPFSLAMIYDVMAEPY